MDYVNCADREALSGTVSVPVRGVNCVYDLCEIVDDNQQVSVPVRGMDCVKE